MTALPAPARRAPAWVSPVLTVAGAVVLAGAVTVTTVQLAQVRPTTTAVRTADAAGLSLLVVDSPAGHLSVGYGGVPTAELRVTGPGGAAGWTFVRDGDRLEVRGPAVRRGPFDWFGGVAPAAELTLPYALTTAPPDAEITVQAGDLDLSGGWGRLSITQDAGESDVTASADAVTAELEAGEARLALSGVTSARLSVDAGDMTADVGGTPPATVVADVDAGDLSLALPDAGYRVTSRVEAGDLSDELSHDSASGSSVDVRVGAGSVVLRPGG